MLDKEQIIIDGVDVSQCEFYIYYSSDRYPHRCGIHRDMFGMPACCDVADCCKNCYFKQLQEEKFENLNNRQMVKSAENLIYENSELYKNLKEREQECEKLTNKNNLLTAELNQIKLLLEGKNTQYNVKVEECEELKKENQELRNSLSDSLMFRFTSQDKEVDRYRKALEEIEKICLEDTRTFADGTQVRYDSLDEILDIINKVKGEVND